MRHLTLPPITTISSEFPTINLVIPDFKKAFDCSLNDDDKMIDSPTSPTEANSERDDDKKDKPVPFTHEEDTGIMQSVLNYFGPVQKVPWSYWQIYKKAYGTWRSTSSLYHHWERILSRKFKLFCETHKRQNFNSQYQGNYFSSYRPMETPIFYQQQPMPFVRFSSSVDQNFPLFNMKQITY